MTAETRARHEANRSLRTPGARYRARMESTSSAALQARLVASELDNLAEVLERLSTDGSVRRAAAITVAARRRFVVGAGKSHAYANLLASDLSAAMAQVSLVDDYGGKGYPRAKIRVPAAPPLRAPPKGVI